MRTSWGVWSRLVGAQFLDWLAPRPSLHWADIGCGHGCSTEQLQERTSATVIEALDPSEEQLAHARALLGGKPVTFHRGNAMALPLADRSVDAAQMALVIFFVPDPERGLAGMIRVTRPGSLVAADAWDVPNHGQCWDPVWEAEEALGNPVVRPPSAHISALNAVEELWRRAGLEGVEATPKRRGPRPGRDHLITWQDCPLRIEWDPSITSLRRLGRVPPLDMSAVLEPLQKPSRQPAGQVVSLRAPSPGGHA